MDFSSIFKFSMASFSADPLPHAKYLSCFWEPLLVLYNLEASEAVNDGWQICRLTTAPALDEMQLELQTHEVMEPVGQCSERRANVYSLVPGCFVCKTSEVYRDAAQSVNRSWEVAVSPCSVHVFIGFLGLCVLGLGGLISSMKFENLVQSIGVFPKVNFVEEEFGL